MAKRKRLGMPTEAIPADLETKSAFSPPPRARMPIAEVAGDTAGRAALEEVARAMTEAEHEGRVVKRLSLTDIRADYLKRDRMVFDADEMAALQASIDERGQQTPIEVVPLSSGGYGLISGYRRLHALSAVGADSVLALVRSPNGSAEDAYRAMVEENEIRADLSFYERANIACVTAEQGVYPSVARAVSILFANASSSKRSKIMRFTGLVHALGKSLRFPAAIPEKLGLALAKALHEEPAMAQRIADALRKSPPADATAERRTLERALNAKAPKDKAPSSFIEISPGIAMDVTPAGHVVLKGRGVDADLCAALRAFLVSHAKE